MLRTAVELLRNGTSSFHGYPLAQAMRGDTQMNYATLYRCLDRLEQRGLLVSTWRVPDGTAQSRRVYEVTGTGLDAATDLESSQPLSIRAFGKAGM